MHEPSGLPSDARRMEAGRLLLAGEPVKQVAARLGITAETVRHYRAKVEAGGLRAPSKKGNLRPESALGPQGRAWIAPALQRAPPAQSPDAGRRAYDGLRNAVG